MTPGQRLYEHKSPPAIQVVRASIAFCATQGDVFTVANPDHIPWRFLSERCKAGWEVSAVGHNLFSMEPT